MRRSQEKHNLLALDKAESHAYMSTIIESFYDIWQA